MKLLSVIMPVYNAEKWLTEALESLLAQTYENMEIICVDDGSTDRSPEIIADIQKRAPQLRLVRQENAGVSAARNRGLEEAKGEYIAFLDADDLAEPEMYKRMIEKLKEEHSDIVFCDIVRFWSNGKVLYIHEKNLTKLLSNTADIKYFFLSKPAIANGEHLYTDDLCGCVWRSVFFRDIIQKHHVRFPLGMKFAEDQIFMMDYLSHARKACYIPAAFMRYRGWTKAPAYHDFYKNHLLLADNQKRIIRENTFYSAAEKKRLIGYVECSAYFQIIHEVFQWRSDAPEIMRRYSENPDFNRLLTWYSFCQKYKIRPEPGRLLLFALLKLRLWRMIQMIYPGKRYTAT